MKITDINGKKRKVEYARKILHDSVDAVTGLQIKEPFVEVVIIGKQNTWTEWYPLEEFLDYNPDFKLEG